MFLLLEMSNGTLGQLLDNMYSERKVFLRHIICMWAAVGVAKEVFSLCLAQGQ